MKKINFHSGIKLVARRNKTNKNITKMGLLSWLSDNKIQKRKIIELTILQSEVLKV